MSRPFKRRRIHGCIDGAFFKPRGLPLRMCEIIVLQLDELEALRQAHILGKTQEEGAEAMGISRSTFQRVLEKAHFKISKALVEQNAIKIEGGPVMADIRRFQCPDCEYEWDEPFGSGHIEECPECGSNNLFRADNIPPHRGKRGGGGHGFHGGR